VCSYLGFESALAYALGRSIGGVRYSPIRLFAAAAEVVVTESQPVRMSPYKTVARDGI